MHVEEKKSVVNKKLSDMVSGVFVPSEDRQVIGNRISIIGKNKRFFRLLSVFEQVSTKKEKVMVFIMERSQRGIDTFNKQIVDHFNWSETVVSRTVDELEEKGLLNKYYKCPEKKQRYCLIPKVCVSKYCLGQLMMYRDNDIVRIKRHRFLLKITQKGKNFIKLRLTDYRSALGLYNQILSSI